MTAGDSLPLRPPLVVFRGHGLPSDGLASIALSWLEIIHDTMPPPGGSTPIHHGQPPLAVALFFALPSLLIPLTVSALRSA